MNVAVRTAHAPQRASAPRPPQGACPLKLLFVTAEAAPLVKTGGLADVCGSLPPALRRRGHDVRLLVPGYPEARERAGRVRPVCELRLPTGPATLLESRLPGTDVQVYLLDCELFRRAGRPYGGPDGRDWSDNALRFATFARAAVRLALQHSALPWAPDVVHAHDWHTGLVPALLSLRERRRRPATVFTVHNLAYQGLFPARTFQELRLPPPLRTPQALEFHDQVAFIKGGLVFADRLTAVSPTYAREIPTPELGCGLDGVLRARAGDLVGILNGIDGAVWDPARDPLIAAPYDGAEALRAKATNKQALQRRLGLDESQAPVFAFLARLVEQKGVDLLAQALPQLARRDLQLVVVGEGEARFAEALQRASREHPGRVAVHVGYTEELAHQVIAGADALLMPSRFEPCGLTQLYALRYGTVPVVRRTGGLADTVVHADARTLALGTATGFQFDAPRVADLLDAVDTALACYRHSAIWRQLVRAGMARDFTWDASAARYEALYEDTLRLQGRPSRPQARATDLALRG